MPSRHPKRALRPQIRYCGLSHIEVLQQFAQRRAERGRLAAALRRQAGSRAGRQLRECRVSHARHLACPEEPHSHQRGEARVCGERGGGVRGCEMNGCCQRGRRGSGHRQARRAAVSWPGLLRTLEAAASSRVVTMQGQSGQPLTLAHIGTPGSSGRAPSPATPPLLGSGAPASAAGPPAASGASVAAPPPAPAHQPARQHLRRP